MTPTYLTGVPCTLFTTHDTKSTPYALLSEDKIRMSTLYTPIYLSSNPDLLLKMFILITGQEER